eukprot:4673180-Prymnesium_polylepis.1
MTTPTSERAGTMPSRGSTLMSRCASSTVTRNSNSTGTAERIGSTYCTVSPSGTRPKSMSGGKAMPGGKGASAGKACSGTSRFMSPGRCTRIAS